MVLLWKKKPNAKSIQAKYYISSMRSVIKQSLTTIMIEVDGKVVMLNMNDADRCKQWFEGIAAAIQVSHTPIDQVKIEKSILTGDPVFCV